MAKSTSNRTFHFFPRLPYELRILIWERAVRPRVVDIRSNRHFKDHPSFPKTLEAGRWIHQN
ncbi:hypothetical protein SMAC4_13479 [Sordaria macrospora]|uniref:uncharacterized protein n=1 Tax=Sordaria macrospora TaxID=5147 RepID=UPI002B311920|nr:hypothetical protein SMAC4_13479 [Sordaria macrospora]